MSNVVIARSGPKGQFRSPITLMKSFMRKTNGTRCISRALVRSILQDGPQIVTVKGGAEPRRYGARASISRLRIGCHVISGDEFRKLKAWALSA